MDKFQSLKFSTWRLPDIGRLLLTGIVAKGTSILKKLVPWQDQEKLATGEDMVKLMLTGWINTCDQEITYFRTFLAGRSPIAYH